MNEDRVSPADPRLFAAWGAWLSSLATDAEAALGAAHAYADLDNDGREAWLAALAVDAPRVGVPLVAVYAPLLAVETDPERRARIGAAIGEQERSAFVQTAARALRGATLDGERVIALVSPYYLRFVRVLTCRYHVESGFSWGRVDPIVLDEHAPQDGAIIDGVTLEATPSKPVIEELALAILAHRRRGAELPDALFHFSDLFDATAD